MPSPRLPRTLRKPPFQFFTVAFSLYSFRGRIPSLFFLRSQSLFILFAVGCILIPRVLVKMPRKKAAIKQLVLPQPSRRSSRTRTPSAKRVHFEEAAETASPPQAKKGKGREVRAHDWARQQAEKEAADRAKK